MTSNMISLLTIYIYIERVAIDVVITVYEREACMKAGPVPSSLGRRRDLCRLKIVPPLIDPPDLFQQFTCFFFCFPDRLPMLIFLLPIDSLTEAGCWSCRPHLSSSLTADYDWGCGEVVCLSFFFFFSLLFFVSLSLSTCFN